MAKLLLHIWNIVRSFKVLPASAWHTNLFSKSQNEKLWDSFYIDWNST